MPSKYYSRISGAKLQSFIRKDGKFKNRNIGIDIDVDRLTKKITKEVTKNLENNGTIPRGGKKATGRRWHTSVVGGTMIATSLLSSGAKIASGLASTDSAQLSMNTYNAVKGTGSLLLSTFGGPIGMVLTVLLGAIDGFVGQKIKNQLQLSFDNARLFYNFSSYDIGRNSTYVYDNDAKKWIARDTKRVMATVLNQRDYS